MRVMSFVTPISGRALFAEKEIVLAAQKIPRKQGCGRKVRTLVFGLTIPILRCTWPFFFICRNFGCSIFHKPTSRSEKFTGTIILLDSHAFL